MLAAVQTVLDPDEAIPLVEFFLTIVRRWEFYVLFAMLLAILWLLRKRSSDKS